MPACPTTSKNLHIACRLFKNAVTRQAEGLIVNWQVIMRSRCAGAMASLTVHMVLMVALAAILITKWDDGLDIEIQTMGESGPITSLEVPFEPQAWRSSATAEFSIDSVHELAPSDAAMVGSALARSDSFWQQRSRQISSLDGEASSDAPSTSPGAQFFGVPAYGRRFVYVVDCSGSMRGNRWNAAREELIRSLKALEPDSSFMVVFFSDNCMPMPGSALQMATPENVEFAANWIRSASIGGGTKPLSSVQLAHGQSPDAIFLLTDGEFADKTARFLRKENVTKGVEMTSVHTIAFHSRAGIRLLTRISSENSGQFRFVPAGEERGTSPISTRLVP